MDVREYNCIVRERGNILAANRISKIVADIIRRFVVETN